MAHLLGILVSLENIEKKSVIFMLKQAQIFNSIEHKFYSIFKIHNRIQRNIGLWIVLPSPQEYAFTRTFENISVLFLTFLNNYLLNVGSHHIFPPTFGGSDGKESACSAGDPGSIPGLGSSPVEGSGYPLQYSCWRIPWTEEPGP